MIESGTYPTEPLSPLATSRPADRLGTPARVRSRALQVEQVRLLYASAPAALAATLVCVVTLVAMEWYASPHFPLLAWLVYMVVLTSLRHLLVRRFQQVSPEQQARPVWEKLFLAGAALSGLGWGSTMFLLLPESSIPHQVFLVLMLGGITAGAVSTLSARLEAFLCFALPTVAPVVAYFLTSGDTLTTAMAAMIVVFAVAMTYVAARVNSTLVHSLNLRLQNTDLLEHIRSQRTQLERAEQARASSDRHYQFFVDQATDIIYRTDRTGRFTFINAVAARVMQCSDAEILGRYFTDFIRPDYRRAAVRFYARQLVRKTTTTYFEFPALAKDGRELWIGQNVQVLTEKGQVTGFQAVARDITERKRVEKALLISEGALRQVLQERERLARNLHDNIIQSIYAIGFTLEECQELLNGSPEDAGRKLDQVIAELNRIIREVRGYLIIPPEESETLSIDELIASLQRLGGLMEHADRMRFTFVLDRVAADLLTAGQRAQFLYVAQEAMSNSLRHSGSSTARVSLVCTTGGIRLEVCDNGVGFALPGIRNGNGGLRNIRVRARKIGANLDITSRPMGGTIVSMEIPVNEHHDLTWKV